MQSPPSVAELHATTTLNVTNIFELDRTAVSSKTSTLRRSALNALDNLEDSARPTLLFHASKVFNLVGLLSRGILLPKVVVSKVYLPVHT